jgi:hypothetical protein
MALSYPKTSGSELNEEIAKSYFLTALGDRKLELKVREREPADLDAAFTIAVRLEAYQQSCLEQQSQEMKDIKLPRVRHADGLPGRVAAIEQKLKDSETIDSRCEELRRLLDGERREKERVTRELGRLKLLDEQRRAREAEAPSATTGGVDRKTQSETPVKCFRCKGLGHCARDCRAFESAAANRSATTNQSDPGNARESQSAENHGTCGQVSGAETGSAARKVYLRLKIWGRTMNCLLDTGSDVTLIPAKLMGKRLVQPSSQKLLAANGTTIDVLGQVTINAKGGHHLFTIHGFVSNHVVEVILGIDFLQSQKALWCFERSEVVLNGHRYKLLSREPTKWTRRVAAAQNVSVPKWSVRLPKNLPNYVVGSVYRDESQAWMASRQIEAAREQGLCCNVCHRFFSQRHGLKYHLERYRQDPAHDAFARETLDSWRNRGRPRLESHDVDRRRGCDGESRRQSRPDGNASFRHPDARYPPVSVRTVSMVSTTSGRAVRQDHGERSANHFNSRNGCLRGWSRPRFLSNRQQTRHRGIFQDKFPRRVKSNEGEVASAPARTLYVGALRLARKIMRCTALDPSSTLLTTKQAWPGLSLGQARVAAAAVFAGIQVTLQAVYSSTESGSLSREEATAWLQMADRVRSGLRITTWIENSSRKTTPKDDISSDLLEFTDVSIEFPPEAVVIPVPTETTVTAEVVVTSNEHQVDISTATSAAAIRGDDASTDDTRSALIVMDVAEDNTPCQLHAISSKHVKRDEMATVCDEEPTVRNPTDEENTSVTTESSTMSIASEQSLIRRRLDQCCRAGTPPFWKPMNAMSPAIEHNYGLCLHVEVPKLALDSSTEPDLTLEERIQQVRSDPSLDLYWVIQETTGEEELAASDTLNHRPVLAVCSEESHSEPQKSLEVFTEPIQAQVSHKEDSTEGLTRTIEIASATSIKESLGKQHEPLKRSKTVHSKKAVAICKDNDSAFGRALASGDAISTGRSDQRNKNCKKPSGSQQGSRETPIVPFSSSKHQKHSTSARSTNTTSVTAGKKRSPHHTVKTSRKDAKLPKLSSETKTQSTRRETGPVQTCPSNDLSRGQTSSIPTCPSVTAKIPAGFQPFGMTAPPTSMSMVDNPFAAAYMFGAMAASMSMFANPCWPVRNETAAGTEAISESTESVSVPPRTAWPNFPGYPFMRWPQP